MLLDGRLIDRSRPRTPRRCCFGRLDACRVLTRRRPAGRPWCAGVLAPNSAATAFSSVCSIRSTMSRSFSCRSARSGLLCQSPRSGPPAPERRERAGPTARQTLVEPLAVGLERDADSEGLEEVAQRMLPKSLLAFSPSALMWWGSSWSHRRADPRPRRGFGGFVRTFSTSLSAADGTGTEPESRYCSAWQGRRRTAQRRVERMAPGQQKRLPGRPGRWGNSQPL